MMKGNKLTNRHMQAMETKKIIFDSAIELFKEYGFAKVSVDDIVKKAGVSKGAFYVHFDSKNSLIAAEVADYINELDLDYKTYVESFPANTMASEILFSLSEKIVDILIEKVGYGLLKVVYEAQLNNTVNPAQLMGYDRDLYRLLTNIVDKGIRQGEFKKEQSAERIARYYVMVIRGSIYEWCIRYPDYDLKEEVIGYFKILLTGIKDNNCSTGGMH